MFRHKPLQAPLLSHRAACLMVRAMVSWPQRAHSRGGGWGLQVRTCDRCTAGHCGGPGEPRHIWELNRRARLCLGNVLRVPGQGLLPPVMVLFLSEGKFKAAHIILTYGPFTGVEGLTGQLAGFINRSGSSEESSCCRVGRGGGGGTGDPRRNPSPWGAAAVAGSLRGFLRRTESCRGAESRL